jgi:cell division protein FtsB
MDGKIPKTVSAALCVLFVLSCVFAVILVLPSYSKYVKMQKKVSALEQNREKIHGEYQALLQEIHDLTHNTFAIEKVAREKYHQCRENELIIIYR